MADNRSLIRHIISVFALTAVLRRSYMQFIAYAQNKLSITSSSTFQGPVASATSHIANSGLGKCTYNLTSYMVNCKNGNPRQFEIPLNIRHSYASGNALVNESIANLNKDYN
jgi:hypothetical protein